MYEGKGGGSGRFTSQNKAVSLVFGLKENNARNSTNHHIYLFFKLSSNDLSYHFKQITYSSHIGLQQYNVVNICYELI